MYCKKCVVFRLRKYRFISEKKCELLIPIENAPGHAVFPFYGQLKRL